MLWRETPVLHSYGDHRNPSHIPHPPQRCPLPKIQTRHLTSRELPSGHVTSDLGASHIPSLPDPSCPRGYHPVEKGCFAYPLLWNELSLDSVLWNSAYRWRSHVVLGLPGLSWAVLLLGVWSNGLEYPRWLMQGTGSSCWLPAGHSLGPLMSMGNSLRLCFVASYCLVAGFPEDVSQADKIRSWALGRPGLGSNMVALLSCSGGHSRSQWLTALILPREGQPISTFQREKWKKELKMCLTHCIAG